MSFEPSLDQASADSHAAFWYTVFEVAVRAPQTTAGAAFSELELRELSAIMGQCLTVSSPLGEVAMRMLALPWRGFPHPWALGDLEQRGWH